MAQSAAASTWNKCGQLMKPTLVNQGAPNGELQFSQKIPLKQNYNVIVVGGGPSGCAAAIAAARQGASTLLIESTGALGGSGTTALVPTWCPFSDREKIIYGGLAEEIFTISRAGMRHIPANQLDWVPIDAEKLKRLYDRLVTDAGVTVLFRSQLCAVETDGSRRVTAIVVANKSGLTAYAAPVFIDCTGDGDLAAWAGAEFQQGDEDGHVQPATHCFVLGNVDEYAYQHGPSLHPHNPQSPIYQILESGKYPLIPDYHICDTLIAPRTVGFNAGHLWNVDGTDAQSLSEALIRGRKIAEEFRRALADYLPAAYGNAFVASTGAVMGIRESRRIVGDYVLTLDDYFNRQSFSDEICRNSYFIDLHLTKDEANTGQKIDVEQRFTRYQPGESHGIPYRCLTPCGLPNVLVAGRSISCDHTVHGSIRVMPVCLAMGEAAGVAAAQALKNQPVDIHTINVENLRQILRKNGGYLPHVEGEK